MELPDILYFYTDDGASWLIKKNKVLPLCARFFTETRPVVIKAISRRWKTLLLEFQREDAMDNDPDFERLVASHVNEYVPVLKALLYDRQLYLIHEEARSFEKGIPESSLLFDRNDLLPLRVLLLLKRKQLLNDVKLLMPFWYTVPIISSIAAFFMNLGRKKKKQKEEKKEESILEKETDDPLKELRNAAREAETRLIPTGHTLDSFLEHLASRWGRLVNKQAKDNLVEDVNSLIRDRLRYILRLQKSPTVKHDTLDQMTSSIIDRSEGLQKLGEQKSLFLYIKLYLVKLLINRTVV
jgi:hypothetical protein